MRDQPSHSRVHAGYRLIMIVLALIFSVGVSACNVPGLDSGSGSDSGSGTSEQEQQAPGAEGGNQGSSGQVPDTAFNIENTAQSTGDQPPSKIVEGGLREPRTLNPLLVSDPLSEEISNLVFDGLTTIDSQSGEPVSELAESWDISDDGTTYTFHLRPDVEWHDGQPFSAQDVAFTYDLMMNDRTRSPRYSRIVERVVTVEAIDTHTVEFELVAPYAPFLSTIATFGIVPQHVLSEVLPDELVTNPFGISSAVGTGPYMLEQWDRGEQLLLLANQNYHGTTPGYSQYAYQVVNSDAELLSGLESEAIDLARIRPEQFDEVDDLENVEARSIPSFEMVAIMLQLDTGITDLFQEPEVREALMLALDREAAVEEIWDGHAEVANGTLPPASWAAQPAGTDYSYNPDRAKELLTDAGWITSDEGIRMRNGTPLQFSVVVNGDNPIRRDIARWVVDSWEAIGIDVHADYETWGNVRDRVTSSREFESLLIGYRWGVDPDQHAMWSSDSIQDAFNLGSYINRDVDGLLEEALTTHERETRQELYGEAQRIVMEDLPALPLVFPNQTLAVGPRLHNADLTAILLRNRAGVEAWGPEGGREPGESAN